ncbi:MAG: D-2-hydroxyacid dehydrogenase [Bryobacteraceae bacterium]
MAALTLLVVANPAARHLKVLDRLPGSTRIVAGNQLEIFRHSAASADILLHALGPKDVFQSVFAMSPNLRWIHSMSAGLDGTLFAELIDSPVPLTNGRGVFARSLGEWTIAAVLFFAKDLRRLVRSQQAGLWEPFDVEWVHGKTLGIVGYGAIGEAIADRARSFGLRIVACRRRPELSGNDAGVFPPGRLHEMLGLCDYVVVAAPLTPETRGLIGEDALRAMKPSAVLINIGRGPVVVEAALERALREGWIRGAALDVFDQEPLPEGHSFYKLENILLSPHSADHTPGWSESAMEFFVQNFERFAAGLPLLNVVDKKAGY